VVEEKCHAGELDELAQDLTGTQRRLDAFLEVLKRFLAERTAVKVGSH